jgi:hypothetical protein
VFANRQRITKPPDLAKDEIGHSRAASGWAGNGRRASVYWHFGDPEIVIWQILRAIDRALKRRIRQRPSMVRGFARGDSMPDIQTDLIRPMPSIVPGDIPALSDDECLVRLAQAVQEQDSRHLNEVARLIGRLAVTIE